MEPRRVAFVTIGQSPRVDLLPEMLSQIRSQAGEVEAVEVGVLDGLGHEAVAALAPAGDAHRLVSRLHDGSEVVIAKAWTQERLRAIVADLDAEGHALIVLLCTGHFDGVRSRTLVVEAQRVVDHAVEALAEGGRTVGVMVPLEEQMREFHFQSGPTRKVVLAHASPYSPSAEDRLDDAARELAATDFIVMHCMGYTDAMRRRVARVSGRPVLLARRLVAGAVTQLL